MSYQQRSVRNGFDCIIVLLQRTFARNSFQQRKFNKKIETWQFLLRFYATNFLIT